MARAAQHSVRMSSQLKVANDAGAQSGGDALGGLASAVLQRQTDFEREVGINPSTYTPLDDNQLVDLVYLDWFEERQGLLDQ